MFNRTMFENARTGGIGVLEIVEAPSTTDETRQQQAPRFVPLKRTELRGEINGPLATLRLRQTYGYTREQCALTLEAMYRFPLPGDAAVTGVRVRFGDVEIVTSLKEREEAEQEYAQARDEGRQAVLVSRESPDVFTLRVTGLEPDQEIVVETEYVQRARAEGRGWSVRVPLTTAPRYSRSDEHGSTRAHAQPLAVMRDPGHRFRLDVTVNGVSAADGVSSATHKLRVTPEPSAVAAGVARVQLAEGEVLPDRDCVLSWQPAGAPDRPALRVMLHDDPADEAVYFLALATPPARGHSGGKAPEIPREVVLLVDHSGSMEGPKWEAADWAVERFLSDLAPRDTFALGLFHNDTRWFSSKMTSGTPGHIADAVRFLKAHRDSGGTEFGVALEQALAFARTDGVAARHVLVITDAEVSDEGRILRLAENERTRQGRRRISVLCIDSAPNAPLATNLAEQGGGVARFLTSSPEADDIATALDDVLRDWAAPVEAGLRLVVNRAGVEAVGRDVTADAKTHRSEIDLGDLPEGRPVWVIGRAPRRGDVDLALELTGARGSIAVQQFSEESEAPRAGAVRALFGADRLARLENLAHSYRDDAGIREGLRKLGYEPDEALRGRAAGEPKVYAENVRENAQQGLRGLLVRESLAFGLATSVTAFVAVRTERGQRVEGTSIVGNALPAGWDQSFALPAAAPATQPRMRMASAPVTGQFVAPMIAEAAFGGAAPAAEAMAEDFGPSNFVAKLADTVTGFFGGRGGASAPPPPPPTPMGTYGGTYDATPPARPDVTTQLFRGTPSLAGGETILFDSTDRGGTLPDATMIRGLAVTFDRGAPDPDALDLEILLYVGDLASPRARVRLADLVRAGGTRPLNLRRADGDVVRVVLTGSAWPTGVGNMTVTLMR